MNFVLRVIGSESINWSRGGTQCNISTDATLYCIENALAEGIIKSGTRNCNNKFQTYWWLEPEWQQWRWSDLIRKICRSQTLQEFIREKGSWFKDDSQSPNLGNSVATSNTQLDILIYAHRRALELKTALWALSFRDVMQSRMT